MARCPDWRTIALAISLLVPFFSEVIAQQKIVIDGSTGIAPLIDALGKAFTAKQSIGVELGKGLGTKARFEALASGKIDLVMASHGMDVADITKRGMTVHRIAMAPVLFGVNSSVTVESLSETQICAIYRGSTRNWKDVGGTELPVAPLVRPESEVDMEVVRSGVTCLKDLKIPEGTRSLARAGDMAKALIETAGSVGMTSATFVAQSGGKIRALSLNDTSADEQSVLAGRYRLTRDAFLVAPKSASPAANRFIDFVKSPEGAAVIRANAAIPSRN
jgi:phosphate transport system substrate-binding protein